MDIFNVYTERVSLQMMIETIAQRTGKVVCTFCGLKKCTMVDYLKPKKYLIFSGEGVQNRDFGTMSSLLDHTSTEWLVSLSTLRVTSIEMFMTK